MDASDPPVAGDAEEQSDLDAAILASRLAAHGARAQNGPLIDEPPTRGLEEAEPSAELLQALLNDSVDAADEEAEEHLPEDAEEQRDLDAAILASLLHIRGAAMDSEAAEEHLPEDSRILVARAVLARHLAARGLTIKDVPKDGDCQFHAIADQLKLVGLGDWDALELRLGAVHWLETNGTRWMDDGTVGKRFMLKDSLGVGDWPAYLADMRRRGTWGDEATLLALSVLFQVEICVISSSSATGCRVIKPPDLWEVEMRTTCALHVGHLAEVHYVSTRLEGDHEHDVREQEELLIACAANIGRGTSTDPLVPSERQPPPRPATAPGAHDAGLDYGASAAMTRVPKRKQRRSDEPSQNRCPACQWRMRTLLSTGADRCQNPKCPVGGERSAKKAARASDEAAPLMVDRERRPAAAAAQRRVVAWISEALGPRAQNGHAFAVGACVELRQGQNGPWQRGRVYESDDPTRARVFMDGVLNTVNIVEEYEARLAPALAPAAPQFAGGCDSGASEACFEADDAALAGRLAAADPEWDWAPLATWLSGSAAPPVVAEEPAATVEAHAAAASEEPAAAPADEARAAAAAKARADAAAERLELVPSSRNSTGFRGVTKLRGDYHVHYQFGGRTTIHLGTFSTPEEAALCYARHVGAERAATLTRSHSGFEGGLPVVPYDRAQLPAPAAEWLDAVLLDPKHRCRAALVQKLKSCGRHAIKANLGRNWLGWGGRLPPPRCCVRRAASQEDEDERGRGVATVAAAVRDQAGCAPWRGGELERRLAAKTWPAAVGPPEPLPPLELDLDVPDGKFWNKPYSYSIDLNLATRTTRAYDVGTFTVVPLIWNCSVGLDQDKVEKIVEARARWTETRAERVNAAAAAVAEARGTPALLTWLNHLVLAAKQRRPSELTVEWVLERYVAQEGACEYTGVQMAFDGHARGKFQVSLERLDRKSKEYLKTNTVLICCEANTGQGDEVNMSKEHADRLYGKKR